MIVYKKNISILFLPTLIGRVIPLMQKQERNVNGVYSKPHDIGIYYTNYSWNFTSRLKWYNIWETHCQIYWLVGWLKFINHCAIIISHSGGGGGQRKKKRKKKQFDWDI